MTMAVRRWIRERDRADARRIRQMMRGVDRPWTGRALAVVVLAAFCVGLWIFAPPAWAEDGDAYTVTATTGVVNIRAHPWLGAEVLGTLYPGDTVTATDTREGWLLVSAPIEAGQGWVCADYLTLDGVPVGTYGNESGGRVRIRKSPGGDTAGWLPDHRDVQVIRWLAVDGTRWAVTDAGYIDGGCLSGR